MVAISSTSAAATRPRRRASERIYVGSLDSNENRRSSPRPLATSRTRPGHLALRARAHPRSRSASMPKRQAPRRRARCSIAENVPLRPGLSRHLLSVRKRRPRVPVQRRRRLGGASSPGSIARGKSLGGPRRARRQYSTRGSSPDGNRLAGSSSAIPGGRLTSGSSSATEVETRFTFGPRSDNAPVWSPDGDRIALHLDRKHRFNRRLSRSRPRHGPGAILVRSRTDRPNRPTGRPTGDSRLSAAIRATTHERGHLDPPALGDSKPFPFLATPFNECRRAVLSRRALARLRVERVRALARSTSRPFPGPGGSGRSRRPAAQPRGGATGRSSSTARPTAKLMSRRGQGTGAALEVGRAADALSRPTSAQIVFGHGYDVTPDGQTLPAHRTSCREADRRIARSALVSQLDGGAEEDR